MKKKNESEYFQLSPLHITADSNQQSHPNISAHLAVINSALEESIIAKYQADNKIISSYIGIHDQFKQNDWTTVSDQRLHAIGYEHWKIGEPSGGNERCVAYEQTGMNDVDCGQRRKFICKIYV